MSSKFGGLAANVSETFRVELIDAVTDDVIRDKAGKAAYIDVLSFDSAEGRSFDKDNRARLRRSAMKSRTGMPEDSDQLEENIRKCAHVTKSWHLVDPLTRELIEVECTVDNAIELYGELGMNWLYVQVYAAAANAGNFIKRKSPTSSTSPSANSEGPAG
jgi:hypothetical protein